MAKLKTIALTISGLSALSGTTHAQAASTETDSSSNKLGMAMMRLNSSLLDQAQTNKHPSGSLWASLRKDFRIYVSYCKRSKKTQYAGRNSAAAVY